VYPKIKEVRYESIVRYPYSPGLWGENRPKKSTLLLWPKREYKHGCGGQKMGVKEDRNMLCWGIIRGV